MTISEPSTLLTDYLLAVVAFVLGARLWVGAATAAASARRLWAAAFLAGGAAAAAGGTVHGFRASLAPSLEKALWSGCLMAAALAGALLVAGAACHVLQGAGRSVLVGVTLMLIVQLGVLCVEPVTRHAVWAGAFWIAALLALVASGAAGRGALLAPLALGLALVGAALVVQRAGWGLHAHFNHNDVAHVLMTLALWPIYRAGLRVGTKN